jgi:hypothetical protein
MQYVIVVVLLLIIIYLATVETTGKGENFTHVVATPTSRPIPAILASELPAPGTLPVAVQQALDEYLVARQRVGELKTKLMQNETLQVRLKAAANNDYNAALQDEMKAAATEWRARFSTLGFAIGKYNSAARNLAQVQKTYGLKVITFN